MDAAGLAQQLLMVDAAIRDERVTGVELAWFGHLQQLAYSRLNDFPDWQPGILAALPEASRAALKGSLEASKELRALHSGPAAKSLPAWKIVAPPPAETLLGYYREAEAAFGIPWQYLAAIHLVETRMGRIRGVSVAGAQGPMQFMPATWAAYGKGDVNDPHDAILGAARYLKAAGAPGDMGRALWAYNHSSHYVNAIAAYAQVMKADPATYRGYHGWQVYYWLEDGPQHLPEGWTKPSL
jgi:soluble lytic murein transglycosylase-like protein